MHRPSEPISEEVERRKALKAPKLVAEVGSIQVWIVGDSAAIVQLSRTGVELGTVYMSPAQLRLLAAQLHESL